MSSTNKLLQEAIADAKAVKETALANARLSLEEMFKPQIESMINRRLTEAEEEEEGQVEEPNLDTNEPDTTEPVQSNDTPISNIDGDTLNIDLTQSSDADSIKTINIDLNEPETPTADSDTSVDESVVLENNDVLDGIELDDVELDDVLANENIDDDFDIELENIDEGDDMIDIDLESLIADEGVGRCGTSENNIDINNEHADDDIDIVLGSRHICITDKSGKCDDDSKEKELEKSNTALSKELEEAYNVIKIMRQELAESTLTNAKLMYANKLFSKYNLTNEQKLKVLDKFDQAKTMEAAKLIYGTINESLSMVGTKTQTTIKESFASRRIGSTRPKQTILENTEDMQRNYLMKLAGIK